MKKYRLCRIFLSLLVASTMMAQGLTVLASPPELPVGDSGSFEQGGTPPNKPGDESGEQGGGTSSSVSYSGANTISSDTTTSSQTYSSTTAEENALLVSGGTSTVTNPTVTKSGSPSGQSDNYDFYGTNAAVLVYNGATLNVTGGTVTTSSSYSSGVFAYGTGIANVSGTTINTSSNNSGAVMVTGGGTLTATNVTATTQGNSSAAIRSDRGGGTLTVTGGKYTTNGTGSPAIYSTADITVNNAMLTSTKSEGIVIEGKNSVNLNGTTLTDTNNTLNGQSTTYKNIFLYQSMSGDASVGTSSFKATDSTITTNKGDTFYITNTSAVIELDNNTFVNNDSTGVFLRAEAAAWGTSGSNGGQVTLTMSDQNAEGDIVIDSISILDMSLSDSSAYTGTINGDNTAQSISLTLDSSSTITLTGNSYITSLSNADSTNSNINLNGYSLYVNGTAITTGGTGTNVNPTSITLNSSALTLKAGNTSSLTATVLPSNATNKTVTWTSSDTSVATVKNGTVTAISAGTATITAKTSNGYKAVCTITVTSSSDDISVIENGFYFEKPSNWGDDINVYIYDKSKGASIGAEWPGYDMTAIGNDVYSYEYSSTNSNIRIIFNDGTNQAPAAMQEGFELVNRGYYTTSGYQYTVEIDDSNDESENETEQLVNNSTLSATSISLGNTVTATGNATGGTGTYTYAVYYKQTAQTKWTTAQNFGTNSTVTFKPAKAATYNVCVKVKDSTDTIEKKYFKVTVTSNALVNSSTLSATNITLGDKITATGKATGGNGTYQYQVVYKQTSQTKWTTAQSFSTNSTVTFKPAKATTYDVCIKVKDSAGTIVKKFFTVTVSQGLTNSSTLSSTSITLGNTVTATCKATGGTGYYNYAVYYKRTSQTSWTTSQNFSANEEVTFKPAAATTYDVCVKVKDVDGTLVKKYFTLTVSK